MLQPLIWHVLSLLIIRCDPPPPRRYLWAGVGRTISCWNNNKKKSSCSEQGYSRGYCVWSTWNGLLRGPRLERVSPLLLCPSEESWSAQSLTCQHRPDNFGTPGPEREQTVFVQLNSYSQNKLWLSRRLGCWLTICIALSMYTDPPQC